MSKPGNLYATLLLTELTPAAAIAQLSFVAALAVHDAISEQAPNACDASVAEMAERSVVRRQEVMRHPAGRRERRRRNCNGGDRHRRELCASSRTTRNIRPLILSASGRCGVARHAFSVAVAHDDARGSSNGMTGQVFRPSAPTGWRARRASAADPGRGSMTAR